MLQASRQDGENAAIVMGRVLDRPPALMPGSLRDETRLTSRWRHGPLHDYLPPLRDHVVMTYYRGDQEISWQAGRQRRHSRIRRGTINLIPQGEDGRWDIAEPVEVSHVYLSGERLQACADHIADGRPFELVGRVGFDDPIAARILEMVGSEETVDEPSARLFVEQAIDLLCTQLIRRHSSLGASREAPKRGLADWQIKKVTAYMREHLDESLGLKDLADLVGLSRFHFCTAFRLATSRTPHDWLTEQRIERAMHLLADPKQSVTDIALQVGYATPSAFTAMFRKAVGATPSQFRRQL